MSYRHLFLALIACAYTACACAEERIETMIVTASRLPLTPDRVAASISLIDEPEIDASASLVLSDLLRTVPALSISQSGGLGSATQVRLRGGEGNQTLVLIDGIEANDPAIGSEFDFAHLLTRGIEHVEVLRGPQSALWGSDALSGVISVTTARPEGPLHLDALAEGGSFGTGNASVAAGAAHERYSFAFNGSYLTSRGTNVAQHGGEDEGYDNTTLNLTGDVTPFEPMTVDFAYRHVRATSEFDPTPFPDFVPVDGDRRSKIQQNYARATVRWKTARWRHAVAATLLDTDNDNFADKSRSSTTAGGRRKLSYQLSRELTRGSSEHLLVFAVEREVEEFTQRGDASVFGDPNQNQNAASSGMIGEYRFDLPDTLSLSVSGRYDRNDAFGNAGSWHVAALRDLNAINASLHASAGTGVKNPTFIERYGFTPDTFIGNPNLDPERSLGAEVGIRRSFPAQHGSADLTVFYERLRDEINGFFFDQDLGGFTAVNRNDDSHRRGLELSFSLQPIPALALRGGYALVDATQPGADGNMEREIRRPRQSGYLTMLYRALASRLELYVSYAHMGARTDENFGTVPATRVKLDAYALVRVAATYAVSEHVSAFTRLENVLDSNYEDVYGFRTPGFGAYAGVRVTTMGH